MPSISPRTFLLGLAIGLISACAGSRTEHDATPAAESSGPSDYLGQPVPGLAPELFAPGVVNTPAIELNGVFSPDLREFFFARQVDGVGLMHHVTRTVEGWSAPQPLLLFPGKTRALAVDMAVSGDGQALYFMGKHPHAASPETPDLDVWVSRRVNGTWATADVVPAPVSTAAAEIYPVAVADGSLYFIGNRPGGIGRSDLFRAQRRADGGFDEPVRVGPPFSHKDGIGDTWMSPDERMAVFTSTRGAVVGGRDLYVSFRDSDGRWSEPANLGPPISSDQNECCPMFTPDGKYFFFSRRWGANWDVATESEVYWVDAQALLRLRP